MLPPVGRPIVPSTLSRARFIERYASVFVFIDRVRSSEEARPARPRNSSATGASRDFHPPRRGSAATLADREIIGRTDVYKFREQRRARDSPRAAHRGGNNGSPRGTMRAGEAGRRERGGFLSPLPLPVVDSFRENATRDHVKPDSRKRIKSAESFLPPLTPRHERSLSNRPRWRNAYRAYARVAAPRRAAPSAKRVTSRECDSGPPIKDAVARNYKVRVPSADGNEASSPLRVRGTRRKDAADDHPEPKPFRNCSNARSFAR